MLLSRLENFGSMSGVGAFILPFPSLIVNCVRTLVGGVIRHEHDLLGFLDLRLESCEAPQVPLGEAPFMLGVNALLQNSSVAAPHLALASWSRGRGSSPALF